MLGCLRAFERILKKRRNVNPWVVCNMIWISIFDFYERLTYYGCIHALIADYPVFFDEHPCDGS